MATITIYSKSWCPFCNRAIALLQSKGADFTEIDIEDQPEKRAEMIERSQRQTVPQVFIDERHIGGCDELMATNASGELDKLLG